MFDEWFCLFQKKTSFRFYGKPVNRAHDTNNDESENLEDSDYQVGSSEQHFRCFQSLLQFLIKCPDLLYSILHVAYFRTFIIYNNFKFL